MPVVVCHVIDAFVEVLPYANTIVTLMSELIGVRFSVERDTGMCRVTARIEISLTL